MGWATGPNGAGFRTQRHWSQDSNVMGPRAQQDELQDPMGRAPGHNGAGPSAQWGGPQDQMGGPQDQMGEPQDPMGWAPDLTRLAPGPNEVR